MIIRISEGTERLKKTDDEQDEPFPCLTANFEGEQHAKKSKDEITVRDLSCNAERCGPAYFIL